MYRHLAIAVLLMLVAVLGTRLEPGTATFASVELPKDAWEVSAAAPPFKVKASLNGLPVREVEHEVVVQPGSTTEILVEVLDVNTRLLGIDVSDFTRHKSHGASLSVLLQPTMGPNPAATASNWSHAWREKWDAAKVKSFCRDDGVKQDFQQVRMTFGNGGGTPITATIKIRSEAICARSATVTLKQTSLWAQQIVQGNGAFGKFNRDMVFNLEPSGGSVLCANAKAPCLHLTGTQSHSVEWVTHVLESDPIEQRKSEGRGGGHGERTIRHVENAAAGQAPPVALFQRMAWDAAARRFRPVFSLGLIDSAIVRAGAPDLLRVPATGATNWHTVITDGCDPGFDWVYDVENVQGRVREEEKGGCYDHVTFYGKTGPLVFGGFSLNGFTRASPLNPRGSGLCPTLAYYAPYDYLSSGPCVEVSPNPYAQRFTTTMRLSGTQAPDSMTPPGAYQPDGCATSGLPCEITALSMGRTDWPMKLSITVSLRRARVE